LQFARVKIPPNVPRFVALDDGERLIPLEQVVGHHLGRLFGGLDVVDHYAFRVTRSADLDVEEVEADDLLEAMESVLRYRHRSAHAVRLEVEQGIGDHVLELLLHGLQLTEAEVYHRTAPLGLSRLWNLYALDRPDLKDPAADSAATNGRDTPPPSPSPGGVRAAWRRISHAFRQLTTRKR
jgi:polyphosphate kinase